MEQLAILGLPSLDFALVGMMKKFRYLKVSLAVVLLLVGIKMLAATWLKETFGDNTNVCLLGSVLFVLAVGILASALVRQYGDGES